MDGFNNISNTSTSSVLSSLQPQPPQSPASLQSQKICTVEELERNLLKSKQQQQQQAQQQQQQQQKPAFQQPFPHVAHQPYHHIYPVNKIFVCWFFHYTKNLISATSS